MPIVRSEIDVSTRIHHPGLVNIYDSVIGSCCNVGAFVEIGNATIGSGCKIGAHSFICPGVTIEDDVFVGPGTIFSNVRFPRAFIDKKDLFETTRICKGATIGAGARIRCGVTIGEYAIVGMGAVVTSDVEDHSVVFGNPAREHGNTNDKATAVWAIMGGEA